MLPGVIKVLLESVVKNESACLRPKGRAYIFLQIFHLAWPLPIFVRPLVHAQAHKVHAVHRAR